MKNRFLPYLLILAPLTFGFIGQLKQSPLLPSLTNTWFSASGQCILCHDTHEVAMRDGSGNDVSPVSQWRSTMLANASKDPFWRAKVKHEGLENPSHKEGLENVCTRCHAPMGMINAMLTTTGDYTLEQLYQDDLGKDGISCTVCHQVDDFHDPRFSGNFGINTNKEIYGPFPNPMVQQMLANTGFTPVHNDQINNARLCGSCHTLFTNSVDENGDYTGSVFVEQALYHEWENSAYHEQNMSCQTCHMPRLDEPIKISSRPPFLQGRQPFGQHTLTGGNLYMLSLLKDNHDTLALHSGSDLLQMTIDRTRQMLTTETADLTIDEIVMAHDTVFVHVSLKNKTGHKFPTGFPSRRAYLECVVTSNTDTLFHSGSRDSKALTDFDIDSFEPHYEVITSEEQVQIYEFVMGSTDGKVTTILERAHIPLKDNRLVPLGFRMEHQNYDTVQVVGRAAMDADYFSAAGHEKIVYAIPQSIIDAEADITVALHYETVPASWLQQMFAYASEDKDIEQFRNMVEASDKTPVIIASDTRSIITTSASEADTQQFRIYPNPSDGRIKIDDVTRNTRFSVFSSDGKHVHDGYLTPGSNQLTLDLSAGLYLIVMYSIPNLYSSSLIISR